MDRILFWLNSAHRYPQEALRGKPQGWEVPNIYFSLVTRKGVRVMKTVKTLSFKGRLSVLGIAMIAAISIDALGTTGTLNITADMQLVEDHFGNIVIAADGIKLDCARYTVQGSGTGFGIDIVGRTGVTVNNCHVEKFGVGFRLENSSNTTLSNNSATLSNSTSGGFLIRNCHGGIKIEKNESFRNKKGRGFALRNSSGVVMEKNDAHNNGFRGFDVGTSSKITLEKNEAADNGSAGIVVYSSSKITMIKNDVTNSAFEGFALLGVSASRFEKNTANHNNTFGIRVSGGSANTFEKNTTNNNGRAGIYLQSTGNTLEKNTAMGSGSNFDLQDTSCPTPANTWINNQFGTANCPAIQ